MVGRGGEAKSAAKGGQEEEEETLRLRRDVREGALWDGCNVGGMLPRVEHCCWRTVQRSRETNWRNVGERERSGASAASMKLKGP